MDKEKLFKKLFQKTGQTIYNHHLINAEDKILIGVSGGKDSLLLLELLGKRKQHLPFKIELSAAHIIIKQIEFGVSIDFIQSICKEYDINFYIEEREINSEKMEKKSPCFACSWERRKSLFQMAEKLGYNKVALGHHKDDAIHTLFLNMIYHGSISSLPYILKMFDGKIFLIRPLLDLEEKIIEKYALLANYPKEIKKCPYDNLTKREKMRELVIQMEKIHPLARKNIFNSMSKIYNEYLPVMEKYKRKADKNNYLDETQI